MAKISIPKASHQGLLEFARMSDEAFMALMVAVEKMSPELASERFREKLTQQFSAELRDTIDKVGTELFQMEATRVRLSLSPEELATAVVKAVSSIPEISDQDKTTLGSRVKTFLGSYGRSVALTRKTEKILTDHDRAFYNARILTDIRPIFSADGDAIQGAVIVHTLAIHYGQDGKHKDLYVALDVDDLDILQKALDRAKKKEVNLRALIQKTDTRYIS